MSGIPSSETLASCPSYHEKIKIIIIVIVHTCTLSGIRTLDDVNTYYMTMVIMKRRKTQKIVNTFWKWDPLESIHPSISARKSEINSGHSQKSQTKKVSILNLVSFHMKVLSEHCRRIFFHKETILRSDAYITK